MSETYSYLGPVAGPDPAKNVTVAFNGPLFLGRNRELFTALRVMNGKHIPGTPDKTDALAIHQIHPGTWKSRLVGTIATSVLQGPHTDLNPEDPRTLVLSDKSILFGITAATKEGEPHPASFTANYPFQARNFKSMTVYEHLPSGKNVLPLTREVAVYRREGREFDTVLTFINLVTQTIIHEIELPVTDVVQSGGRYGLTGGTRIWDEKRKSFRMLLHGFSRGLELVKYALVFGTFTPRNDGTFDPSKNNSIDHEPALTYQQAVACLGSEIKPDADKDAMYSVGTCRVGQKLIAAVTTDDKKTGLIGFHVSN